jgi:hypothetical protein
MVVHHEQTCPHCPRYRSKPVRIIFINKVTQLEGSFTATFIKSKVSTMNLELHLQDKYDQQLVYHDTKNKPHSAHYCIKIHACLFINPLKAKRACFIEVPRCKHSPPRL